MPPLVVVEEELVTLSALAGRQGFISDIIRIRRSVLVPDLNHRRGCQAQVGQEDAVRVDKLSLERQRSIAYYCYRTACQRWLKTATYQHRNGRVAEGVPYRPNEEYAFGIDVIRIYAPELKVDRPGAPFLVVFIEVEPPAGRLANLVVQCTVLMVVYSRF